MIGLCLSRLGYKQKTQTLNHFKAHMMSIDTYRTSYTFHSSTLYLITWSLNIGFYLEPFFRLEKGKPQKSSLKKEKEKKCETIVI